MVNTVKPTLSIVVPTREGFSDHWLQELLKVEGEVEFILVHPPGMAKYSVADSRLQQINSSFRGEIIQRLTGLFNTSGKYVLTVNCDEYLIPNIAEISLNYFEQFPDSWVLRLSKKAFEFGDKASLENTWSNIPQISKLKICTKEKESNLNYDSGDCLLEIPIAPLDKKIDFLCFLRRRKDHHGLHTENFDKKVWKNEMLQEALKELGEAMILGGPIKYVPFWCLDRLLGLFMQAKFFEKGKIIGHLMPLPEQIRVEENPPDYRKSRRFYLVAEVLLLKKFPQYGYLWNLIIDQVRGTASRGFNYILRRSN